MILGDRNQQFGIAWLAFGYVLALHVLDEAGHDFLSVYNPNALAIRHALPFLRVPVFTFQEWIGSLSLALALWLALTPLAFRGLRWMRWLAIPVAILAGIGNALGHIGSSIYYGRLMPGVYSAPLILLAGIWLLRNAVAREG
ncbi:MAG: HXXEE domain-containing protein [Terriglobales bacterium]